MPKYRGFMKEVSLNALPGEPTDRFNLGGLACHNLGAAFSGPRRTVAYAPTVTPVAVAAPAPSPIPTVKIQPYLPGIEGDIRDITARTTPGVAIEDSADDMLPENGVPGVDNGGAFPYGDPRTGKTGAEKAAPGNVGLVIAAVLAMLLLGG
jgi:hypothetical protein